MTKKSVSAVLFSLLLTIMLGTPAFAAEETVSPEIAEALAEVEEVNAEIYAEISEAQLDATDLYNGYLSESAEEEDAEKLAELAVEYEEKVTALINNLDYKTQEMTRNGMEKAIAAGLNVEIVWVPVQFPDRVVMIDPIHVIDW